MTPEMSLEEKIAKAFERTRWQIAGRQLRGERVSSVESSGLFARAALSAIAEGFDLVEKDHGSSGGGEAGHGALPMPSHKIVSTGKEDQ